MSESKWPIIPLNRFRPEHESELAPKEPKPKATPRPPFQGRQGATRKENCSKMYFVQSMSEAGRRTEVPSGACLPGTSWSPSQRQSITTWSSAQPVHSVQLTSRRALGQIGNKAIGKVEWHQRKRTFHETQPWAPPKPPKAPQSPPKPKAPQSPPLTLEGRNK